jgi:hypothetical protein
MRSNPEALRREMMAAGDRLLSVLKLEDRLASQLNKDSANARLLDLWLDARRGVENEASAYTLAIAQYRESMAAVFVSVSRKRAANLRPSTI